MSRDSAAFYDALAAEYNAAILRCVPRYDQMLDTIVRYVPDDLAPGRILELGCGGGNLTRRLVEHYPEAEVHAVDFSGEMIGLLTRGAPGRLHAIHSDFRDLEFEDGSLDLVVSSISLHHLDDAAKQVLFARIHAWLRPGGVLCYSDQFAGEAPETYAKHMASWKEEAAALGATPTEWEAWMRHQDDHDHHAPLRAQMQWLAAAGFEPVDCVWRYLLWTVILAER